MDSELCVKTVEISGQVQRTTSQTRDAEHVALFLPRAVEADASKKKPACSCLVGLYPNVLWHFLPVRRHYYIGDCQQKVHSAREKRAASVLKEIDGQGRGLADDDIHICAMTFWKTQIPNLVTFFAHRWLHKMLL